MQASRTKTLKRAITGRAQLSPSRKKAESLRLALLQLGPALLRVEDFTLDLPLRQLEVCVALAERRLTMSEIARRLGISLSALTQIADRLERAGMVERVFNELDRRVRFLQLTPKANGMMGAHKEAQLAKMADCLERLSEAESAQLLNSLQKLVGAATGELQPEPV